MKLSFSGVSSDVGPGMGQPDEIGVAARRVDDHEIDRADHLLQCRFEPRLLVGLGGGAVRQGGERHRGVHRHRQVDALALAISRSVLEVAAERALARVEIERGHLRSLAQQRHGDMQRRCRFARAALLVADHQHMGAFGHAGRLRLRDAGIACRLESVAHRWERATPWRSWSVATPRKSATERRAPSKELTPACGSRRRCRGTPRRRAASRDRPRSAH